MKKKIIYMLVIFIIVFGAVSIYLYPTYKNLVKTDRIDLDPHLTVFKGGGGNSMILFSDTDSRVLLVDTKIATGASSLREYMDSSGKEARLTIINTHYHPDHAGGNDLFPEATFITGNYSDEEWSREVGDRLPDERVPTGQEKVIPFGSETVIIRNMGQAHTTNDTIVYLKNRKLLMTGDLIFSNMHPVLRDDSGADVEKWINVLKDLQDRYEINTLIPGHGPVADGKALMQMEEYFRSIRDARKDPEELAVLKDRYKDYFSLPASSSFDRTLEYIQNEYGK